MPGINQKIKSQFRRKKPKRFYASVSHARKGKGYFIQLDGRPVRTPSKACLTVPGERLAVAIAEEWRHQKEYIDNDTMHLTRLASIAIDKAGPGREAVINEIAGYAGSDHACYRAGAPKELYQKQCEALDPVLSWIGQTHAIRLLTTTGIMPVEQPRDSLEACTRVLRQYDDLQLAAIHQLTRLTASAVLTLALADEFLPAEKIWSAAHIDEEWNMKHWGRDEEAVQRLAARRMAFDGAVRFLSLLEQGSSCG